MLIVYAHGVVAYHRNANWGMKRQFDVFSEATPSADGSCAEVNDTQPLEEDAVQCEKSTTPAGASTSAASIDSPIAAQGPAAMEDIDVSKVPTSGTINSVLADDIGCFINATMSAKDVGSVISSMSDGQKYHLLKNHFVPSLEYTFPATADGGCNRSFQREWLEKFPWMVYSPKLDGAFCITCALFVPKNQRSRFGALVNRPFIKWHKKSEVCDTHDPKGYHDDAEDAAKTFTDFVEQPEKSLPSQTDKRRNKNIKKNRHILTSIAEAVLYCGRQCIALRGDNEDINAEGNPGNFLALLKLLAKHDPVIERHLSQPAVRNAKYLSPRIQNEMIEVIGKHIIQAAILAEIKQAEFFTILADEVSSHSQEEMALCIRFVDCTDNIREEFIEFCPLKSLTGKAIGRSIVTAIQCLDLDITKCRGQGYDGAANMSSEAVGVQAYIRALSPRAYYVHCSSHLLNLAIAHSCSLPVMRNVIDTLRTMFIFFDWPKRSGLLDSITAKEHPPGSKRKPLIGLCKTRWAERHDSYGHFYTSYTYVVKALEVICAGLHKSEYDAEYTEAVWDSKTKTEANGLLTAITNFQFIVNFMALYSFLSHLEGITVGLQKSALDILEAYSKVAEVKTTYRSLRDGIDGAFASIYRQAERVAAAVNVEPRMPRISTGRQTHRDNAPSYTIFDHYKINTAIPFVDHMIAQLDARFSPDAHACASVVGLVPVVLVDKKPQIDDLFFADVIELYRDDLPSPELFSQELIRWKQFCADLPLDSRPVSLAQTLKLCRKTCFPNIHTLMKLACTVPVTSCECERSASCLRRLHTFNRASMTQNRLSALALMHIHYDYPVELQQAVDVFARLHPRRLELDSVLLY